MTNTASPPPCPLRLLHCFEKNLENSSGVVYSNSEMNGIRQRTNMSPLKILKNQDKELRLGAGRREHASVS